MERYEPVASLRTRVRCLEDNVWPGASTRKAAVPIADARADTTESIDSLYTAYRGGAAQWWAHLLLMGVHTSIWLVFAPLPTVFMEKVAALGAAMRARPALEGWTLTTAAGQAMREAQTAAIASK